MFTTPHETLAALRAVGYYTNLGMAAAVWKSWHGEEPILLEGPAGAGKTKLAEAVAEAVGTHIVRLQCVDGTNHESAIGYFNRAQQNRYAEYMRGDAPPTQEDWVAFNRYTSSRDFFVPGPLLQAIESPTRCVLLIDEVDKVEKPFEAVLLEILSAWQISIPTLGTIRAVTRPFTVLTSNAERRLGDPLRRRANYCRITYPTAELEAEIIARALPELPEATHRFLAGLGQSLRTTNTFEKPPSISEMISIAKMMAMLGITQIEPTNEHRDLFLPVFAKTPHDVVVFFEEPHTWSSLISHAQKAAEALKPKSAPHADVIEAPLPIVPTFPPRAFAAGVGACD